REVGAFTDQASLYGFIELVRVPAVHINQLIVNGVQPWLDVGIFDVGRVDADGAHEPIPHLAGDLLGNPSFIFHVDLAEAPQHAVSDPGAVDPAHGDFPVMACVGFT